MTGSEDAPGDGNSTGDRDRGRLNSQRDLWYSGRSSRIAPIYQRSCLFARRHAAPVIFLDRAARSLTPRHWVASFGWRYAPLLSVIFPGTIGAYREDGSMSGLFDT